MKTNAENWRNNFPVLVTEAEMRMSVGVIRSLGRAGYPVHACSSESGAVGYQSRFTYRATRCPGYQDPRFIPWLREYVTAHDIRCIIPTEFMLLPIRHVYQEFSSLMPVNDDEDVVYRGMSKYDLFQTLRNCGGAAAENLPPHILIESRDMIPNENALSFLGSPLYLKADGIYSLSGDRSVIEVAATPAEAPSKIRNLLNRYRKLLVQGHVDGKGVGAFLLSWDDTVLADFMHMRLHEVPPSGVSSYRKSWWHDAIMEDAKAKLDAMQWRGVAMLEYRWNPSSNEFSLLEMNGRFWGSIHLALFAGIDFPAMLVDAFHGHTPDCVSGRLADVKSRHTFPLEIRYVRERLTNPRVVVRDRLWAALEFFLLSLNPKVRSDMLFPGDRVLYWHRLREYAITVWRKLARSK